MFKDDTQTVKYDGKFFPPGTEITKSDGSKLSKDEQTALQNQGIGVEVVTPQEAESMSVKLDAVTGVVQDYNNDVAELESLKAEQKELAENKPATDATPEAKSEYSAKVAENKKAISALQAKVDLLAPVVQRLSGMGTPEPAPEA